MEISKEEWATSIKKLKRLIFEFLDSEKADATLNEIFPLVIIAFMAKCDVSRIGWRKFLRHHVHIDF